MIFAFSEAVTDAAGEELRSDDFVIKTGVAGVTLTDTLTAETDYTIVDNLNDTKFLIRPSAATKTALGKGVMTISGLMAGTPQDLLGNSMAAGASSSYQDTISE